MQMKMLIYSSSISTLKSGIWGHKFGANKNEKKTSIEVHIEMKKGIKSKAKCEFGAKN